MINLTGMYLTYLFSINKNFELNLLLESLNLEQKNNTHIQFISNLVKYFKIGSYRIALEYSKKPPSELYHIITSRIIETIRVEIFKNILSTIEEIEFMDLKEILEIQKNEDLNHFLVNIKNILPEENWLIEGNKLKINSKKNNYRCNFDNLLVNTIDHIEEFDKIFS